MKYVRNISQWHTSLESSYKLNSIKKLPINSLKHIHSCSFRNGPYILSWAKQFNRCYRHDLKRHGWSSSIQPYANERFVLSSVLMNAARACACHTYIGNPVARNQSMDSSINLALATSLAVLAHVSLTGPLPTLYRFSRNSSRQPFA